ncbi:hypothetical protein K432DRAFT_424858 [Lepidopterella palustris CBS 459.81]|uniref:Uncharacterized protein n=1 Tax=Lepidopterella palustris CBS 459.81 TaxID=1314670 RepID=A0A8E2ED29_9PEZI|nr:hypothetical protein K432DRAFT_424858 [Lepidopterella palustris CBS 459.81]
MMAPISESPKKRVRSAGRPRIRNTTAPDSAPPLKKRKYIPGGPGGGGRYVDAETGEETPVGGTGPGGYAYTGPRGRVGRMNAEKGIVPPITSPTLLYTRPRRERPPVGPRSSSAAAAAAVVAQSDGYKPREERGWEEFHQDLDIDAEFMVFSADEVDGISPPESKPATPNNGLGLGLGQYAIENGASALLDEALRAQQDMPILQAEASAGPTMDGDTVNVGGINGKFVTPLKRRVGRPPRRLDSMLNGLGSPPAPRIIPVPTHNPKEKLNLQKPSYRQVDPFAYYEQDQSVQVNYVDRTMASLGYQESDIFLRPEKTLIRVAEGSIEEDLDLTLSLKTDGDLSSGNVAVGRVEYDMDEQDDRWLEAFNTQRKEEQVEAIKPAIFEVTITQIEKEWHSLEKRIPKPNPKPPQTHRPRSSSAAAVNGEPAGHGEEQDTKCAICDDGDCENTNAIVFCDGCDLAVHQECYGVPFIPEGQWLCRRCQLVGRGTPVSEHPGCIFCPNIEGAFKQTTTMKWAHLLCAIWIPEVSLGNTTFMEPVQDVEKVPKTRWKLNCYICKQKMGACIQCGNKSCYEAFHVSCARRARLFMKMKSNHGTPGTLDASVLKAFCDKHSPPDWRKENDVSRATADAQAFYRTTMRYARWGDSQSIALSIGSTQPVPSVEGPDELAVDDGAVGNKRKRGQPAKSWRLPSGAPVVPQAVYHNVENALIKFGIRKRKEFVAEACKYWTLKREARRGAALLKRLQLQMEAFSSMEITRRNFAGMGAAGRPRLQRRIDFAERLEDDMEQIRVLCEKIREREAAKLKDVEILKMIVDTVYFPIPPLLWPILEKAQNLDPKNVFYDGFKSIQTKLEERFYTSVATFSKDLAVVFSSVIGFAAITDTRLANNQLNGVSHSSLTPEQKEKKKLAKRIIKAIQTPLDDATRKESELGGKPFEREVPNLEALLDQSLRRQVAATSAAGKITEGSMANSAGNDAEDHHYQDIAMEDASDHMPSINGLVNGDGDLRHAHTPDADEAADVNGVAHDETADDAAIRLQISENTIQGSTAEAPLENVTVNTGGDEDAPALSNSGSTNPSTANPEPLTPPRSEKDLLAPLAYGGIPWYVEPFDPVGTTIHDERWTGREVLRDMSEELSELDDDELNGLADPDDIMAADGMLPETSVSSAVQKSARKQKKRWKGYK